MAEWTTNRGDIVEIYASEIGDGTLAHPLEYGWRYRVRSRNGRIVEIGSEGFTRRHGAVRAALRHHPRIEQEDQP
jgi:hypothetical protein